MELPASFADYDLICDGPFCTNQPVVQDAYFDITHAPSKLGFVPSESFSEGPLSSHQRRTPSLTCSDSYPAESSSLHSSLGSTESYSYNPRPNLCMPLHSQSSRLYPQSPIFSPFSFIPIEPVITLDPPPTLGTQQQQHEPDGSRGAATCQPKLPYPTGTPALTHPDVSSHLQELSNCFSPAAAQQQMSQLLHWEATQTTGSPSQSCDSTTPSCNSTNTQGSRGASQMRNKGSLAAMHSGLLDHYSPLKTPLQHPQLTLNCPDSNFTSFLDVRPPQHADPQPLSMTLSSALELHSPASKPSSGSQPTLLCAVQDRSNVALDPPKSLSPRRVAHAQIATPGFASGPGRKAAQPAAQPKTSRPVRQSAANRRIKYSDQLETSSDSEAAASKVKKQKVKQVQRPRRANSKPARFCEDSGSEDDLDADGWPKRKQHNPWSMEETWALVQGVEECGGGKWADIKRHNYKAIEKRTAVDLKDKWRNLLRLAVVPPAASGKADRRRELPAELVNKVRMLHSLKVQQKAAAKDVRPGAELGLSRSSSRLKRSLHV